MVTRNVFHDQRLVAVNCFGFALAVIMLFDITYAAPSGGSPMGKPFIEIAGQIVEVQNDISTLEAAHQELVAKVDSLGLDIQGKIDALSADISSLKMKDTELQTSLSNVVATLEAQGKSITSLLVQLSAVNQDIVTLTNSAGDNSAAIDDLEIQHAQILSEIAAMDAGLVAAISAITENQSLIELLQKDIANLTAQKQEEITGACSPGTFVQVIRDDGTLECGESISGVTIDSYSIEAPGLDMDNVGELEMHCHFGIPIGPNTTLCLEKHYHNVASYQTRKVAKLECPSGSVVTGGGYRVIPETGDVIVLFNRPAGPFLWEVGFKNVSTVPTDGVFAYAFAKCVRLLH